MAYKDLGLAGILFAIATMMFELAHNTEGIPGYALRIIASLLMIISLMMGGKGVSDITLKKVQLAFGK